MLAPLSLLLAGTAAQGAPSRFEKSYVLGSLPPIVTDTINSPYGIAQSYARSRGLQARILWVDGTANLDKVSDDAKVDALVAKVKESGFNTIVFDVKPISGQTLYPSKYAPKIEAWKGKTLPKDYDPLARMSRKAKDAGLMFYVSLNSFSEGHNLFKAGPGYSRLAEQTFMYESTPMLVVRTPSEKEEEEAAPISKTLNKEPNGAELAVFTDRKALPTGEGWLYIAVDKRMRVVAIDEEPMDVPAGGAVYVGKEAFAEFIDENVSPGQTVSIQDQPRFVPISQHPELQYPLMMNPHHPKVREYVLNIVREIASNYPVDGIVFDDRLRYAGLYADFSPAGRNEFERQIKHKIVWPDDVFHYTYSATLKRGIKPGRYFDAWLTFRARTMREWVGEVRGTLKAMRPGLQLGVYAGSWYGEYQQFGNSYASPDFEAGFWFLTSDYRKTGFADELDFLVTGCYYPTATIYDAMIQGDPIGSTVESAGQLSNRAARDMTWTAAGISLDQFGGNPEGLGDALQAACASTQGVMVFDLSHNIEPMWPVFARAFSRPSRAPMAFPKALEEIRGLRRKRDAQGLRDQPVPIAAGSSGVGF